MITNGPQYGQPPQNILDKLIGGFGRKHLGELLAPIREDFHQIATHEERVDQRTAVDGIVDDIAAQRSAIGCFENVLMMPISIRSAHLFVDKSERRLPDA